MRVDAALSNLSPDELTEVRRWAQATAERAAQTRVRRMWFAFADDVFDAWSETRRQWTEAAVLIEETFDDETTGEIIDMDWGDAV